MPVGQAQGCRRISQWAPPLTWSLEVRQKLVATGWRGWEMAVEVDTVAAREGNGIAGGGKEEEVVGHQQTLKWAPGVCQALFWALRI